MSARKRYTPEFRRDAASLVIERGETIAQVARDLNVGESLFGRWVKLERERREAESKGAMTSTQWAKENAALRREVARLRMENEFLGKASAIDASKLDSRVFRVDGRGEGELPDCFDGSRVEGYSTRLLCVAFPAWGSPRT